MTRFTKLTFAGVVLLLSVHWGLVSHLATEDLASAIFAAGGHSPAVAISYAAALVLSRLAVLGMLPLLLLTWGAWMLLRTRASRDRSGVEDD